MMIAAKNDSASCLQGCYSGDCGAGTDNYLALAACDERLSQLWLVSTVNRNLVNVASGYCLSITSDDVVVMAGCGNSSPAQTWALYANDTLEPQSNRGSFLSVCTPGAAGCNPKIMGLFSNDGQLVTVANNTDEAATLGSWEQVPPSTNASLIQNFFGSTGTANASFSAAVSASSPWCMQRCSGSDCGDATLDSSIVLSSICDERLGQMWYNDSTTIRSRLTDECITICGISTAEAHASKGNTSVAASCLGKGSDYYNIETQACSGGVNQLWEWAPTPAGSVLFNRDTSQAIKVCSDLEPWCGFLLLLTFDASWSARRLTGVRLPTNLSDVTAFQTFSAAVPTKVQAGELKPTVVDTTGPYSVPPAPAAPSGNQASIESFDGEGAVPFPDPEEPLPPTPKASDSAPDSFGTFLAVSDGVPPAPVINQART
ncbi:hypothetical protein ABBQ38_013795 [Trebouxia sp. C0009 RCD-2024]